MIHTLQLGYIAWIRRCNPALSKKLNIHSFMAPEHGTCCPTHQKSFSTLLLEIYFQSYVYFFPNRLLMYQADTRRWCNVGLMCCQRLCQWFTPGVYWLSLRYRQIKSNSAVGRRIFSLIDDVWIGFVTQAINGQATTLAHITLIYQSDCEI